MKMSTRATIAIAGTISVILAASLIFVSEAYFPAAGSPTITTHTTLTSYTTFTKGYLNNGNVVVTPSLSDTPCVKSVKSQPLSFILTAKSDSPASLCVAYYYYDSASTMNLNTTAHLRIFGWPRNPTGVFSSFDAGPNFTVTASVASLEIGGPSNMNEGIEVTYHIQPKPGVAGTFEVGLENLLPGGIGCDADFLLVAGTGNPSYARAGVCYLVPYNHSSYPLSPGFLFVTLIGATNSTA